MAVSKNIDTIRVRNFFESYKEELGLELVAGGDGLDKVILEPAVNRPALAITGYFQNFGSQRIQLFGAGEMAYLKDLNSVQQESIIRQICEKEIPCCVVSRSLEPLPAMKAMCEEMNIALFSTTMRSKDFTSESAILLGRRFAPKTSIHGTLMDVKGVGVLIRGASGIGKSECALALIERGHSLVSDDLTYCELAESLVIGKSGDINRGYMECRGIGIIDVAKLFGIRCVRTESMIGMVVTFLEWKPGMVEERTGLNLNYFELLGVKIPHIEIPVRPGRDMARLVEVAAMVQALRSIGHDCAKEFNDKLIRHMNELTQ
ncbi:MAG: HPr(Ser) kinase/phosphatase [Opitutales bacterium]